MKLTATKEKTGPTELLCGLLLEFAGRSSGRMLTARRHVVALDAALPYMTAAPCHVDLTEPAQALRGVGKRDGRGNQDEQQL